MATSLTNRAAVHRTLNFLRLSSNFLRGFTTTLPSLCSQHSSASSSESKKPKRKKKKNLFEVAQFLPNWGIGYHMAKTHWVGVSYQITKINLYKVIFLCLLCLDLYFLLLFNWFFVLGTVELLRISIRDFFGLFLCVLCPKEKGKKWFFEEFYWIFEDCMVPIFINYNIFLSKICGQQNWR